MKLAWLVLLPGCAQLLGLDNTKFDQKDAMTDAKSACDGVPEACASTSGRAVCGQLFDTGINAGMLLRAPDFTGAACDPVTTADGPCALQVYGQPMASYFMGISADRVMGTVDDCGRFAVPDLPAANADIAIVFDGATIVETTTLLIGRPTTPGESDTGIVAPVVRTETETRWAQQISTTAPPGLTGSFLITYQTSSTDPIKARVDGGALKPIPTQPWGAYFMGTLPFADVDPAQTGSGPSGGVLVLPSSGAHTIDGTRPGKSCSQITVQPVGTALIHVPLKC